MKKMMKSAPCGMDKQPTHKKLVQKTMTAWRQAFEKHGELGLEILWRDSTDEHLRGKTYRNHVELMRDVERFARDGRYEYEGTAVNSTNGEKWFDVTFQPARKS